MLAVPLLRSVAGAFSEQGTPAQETGSQKSDQVSGTDPDPTAGSYTNRPNYTTLTNIQSA